jgi:hypothetical protein
VAVEIREEFNTKRDPLPPRGGNLPAQRGKDQHKDTKKTQDKRREKRRKKAEEGSACGGSRREQRSASVGGLLCFLRVLYLLVSAF